MSYEDGLSGLLALENVILFLKNVHLKECPNVEDVLNQIEPAKKELRKLCEHYKPRINEYYDEKMKEDVLEGFNELKKRVLSFSSLIENGEFEQAHELFYNDIVLFNHISEYIGIGKVFLCLQREFEEENKK